MSSIVHREYECIISQKLPSMLYIRSVGICDGHWSSVGVSTMQAECQKRTAQKDEEQGACPIECGAVDMVGRRPESPEEL